MLACRRTTFEWVLRRVATAEGGVEVRGGGIERPETLARSRQAVQEMVRAGAVKPAIAKRFRLEDYAEAMHAAYNGKEAGRVVLLMD